MTRPVPATLRAVADVLDALPTDLPKPTVGVSGRSPEAADVSWHNASADEARAVMAALPGEWKVHSTGVLRYGDAPVRYWMIHLAPVWPTPVVDPAALVAEVSA